jgi:hypothetical protein
MSRDVPLLCLLLLLSVRAAAAQPPVPDLPPRPVPNLPPVAVPELPVPGAVSIYLDCQNIACDLDYFRTEIAFVAHVRSRHDADVHVLITGEPTAAGGTQATIRFIGQRAFAGDDETLRYVSAPDATADQRRQGLANTLKRGLVRYANRSLVAEGITVLYTSPADPAAVAPPDRWNRWSFAVTVNGYMSGEERVGSRSLGGSMSAGRVTDDWKVSASVYTQYDSSRFDIGGDVPRIVSVQRNHAANALVARSMGQHWAAGGRASVSSSTYLNQALTVRAAPALEFNVFPYRESTRRMLTVEYSLGATALDYEEETIFGRTRETLVDQRILASLRLTQPWGSVGLGVEGSHYLHDVRKNRAIVIGHADWSVLRGLSFSTLVSAQRIRDQVFLSARGVSDEEILLRQRQLATAYSYSASFGISYRFGSPYAHVVNRRFAGSVGGMSLLQ